MSESPIQLRGKSGGVVFDGTQSPGGGSMPFQPTDLDNLALWLDASDASTINGGAPSDGDPVSAWADKSGQGNDAAQATADNQPTFKTATQNGHSVVRLNASAHMQWVELSGAGLDLFRNIGSFTAFAAVSQDVNQDPTGEILVAGIDSVAAAIEWFVDAFAGQIDLFHRQTEVSDEAVSGLSVGPQQVPLVRTYFCGIDYETCALLVGASEPFAPITATDSCAPGPSPDVAADSIRIGAYVGANEGSTGDYCEMIVYQRTLNAAERRQVLEYLSAKWATP